MISASEALELVEGVKRTRRALIDKTVAESLKEADRVIRNACHEADCSTVLRILKNSLPESFTIIDVSSIAEAVTKAIIDEGFNAHFETENCGQAVAFNVFIDWSLGGYFNA